MKAANLTFATGIAGCMLLFFLAIQASPLLIFIFMLLIAFMVSLNVYWVLKSPSADPKEPFDDQYEHK